MSKKMTELLLDVTTAYWIPGSYANASRKPIVAEGHEDGNTYLSEWRIGADLIPFYGLELVAGRNFFWMIPRVSSL